jgi:hypothetical protein
MATKTRRHEEEKSIYVCSISSSCLRVFVPNDAADDPDAAPSSRSWIKPTPSIQFLLRVFVSSWQKMVLFTQDAGESSRSE